MRWCKVGTNLPMHSIVAAVEARLAKPVVAVNVATWWHALRCHGIADRLEGAGRLLASC